MNLCRLHIRVPTFFSHMLFITLFLFSSSLSKLTSGKKFNVNMQTSTVEPASAASKETSKDVLVFQGIRPKKGDEPINIGIPYTHLNSRLEAAVKIINHEIKKINNNKRSEYKKLLVSLCSTINCENNGICFKIGGKAQCACRQLPEYYTNGKTTTQKLRVYFESRDNCRKSKLIFMKKS